MTPAIGTVIGTVTDPTTGLKVEVVYEGFDEGVIISLQIADDSPVTADLRGFFFDYNNVLEDVVGYDVTKEYLGTSADGSDISGLTGKGYTDVNMLGTGETYDAGIAFGTAGIGKDDIDYTTFTLKGLSLDDLDTLSFGVRATSVGTEDGTRDGSVKLTGTFDVTEINTNSPPVAVADSNGSDAVIEAGVNPGNTSFPGDPSATGNVLTNDTDVDAGDSKTVVGVQAGTASGPISSGVGNTITGTYGTLTLAADGSWTYALDNTDEDTNALAQGQAASDVFAYTIIDSQGATSTTTLTIGITGTNDAPDAVDDKASMTESLATVTSNVLTNDTDPEGDSLTVTQVNGVNLVFGTDGYATVTLAKGTLKIDASGEYTYTYTGSALGVGAEAQDSFTYTISDGQATDTATVSLTIDADPGSPGYWANHASDWDIAQDTSFESYFGVSGPYSGNWDTTSPINGAGTLAADITLQEALSLSNGDGGQNLLAKEATTALLNLLDVDPNGAKDGFITNYVYQRANFASSDADAKNDLSGLTDAEILADLKQQVQDAFANADADTTNDVADAYTVTELSALLKLTHEV